jgi:hypothetical protein
MQPFTITRIKFLDPPLTGHKRSYRECCECGRIYVYDYQPYSLSNPILTADCAHDPRRFATLPDREGMTRLVLQRIARETANV